MTRELRVYLDGDDVGQITQSAGGALEFVYADTYVSRADPTPLSLSMPTRLKAHPNKPISAFLDGLLPDNPLVRQRWGRTFGVSPNSPFALLRHVGRDAAGAVQVLPPGDDPDDAVERRGHVEWLGDSDLEEMLHELAEHRADWNPGRASGRWSLAGAQAKLALYRDSATGRWGIPQDSTPTTHILKPAQAGLDDHHLNEFLCLSAARAVGVPASRVDVMDTPAAQVLVATRYDRAVDSSGRLRRLHQEDLCQALAIHPDLKYQADGGPGVARIADLLSTLEIRDREPSRRRFFDGLALNVLIGGTDAHAKNYSLLLAGGRAQLAPLYDVASAAPYGFHEPLNSAMKIGAHYRMRSISDRDFSIAGQRLGLTAEEAVARITHLRRNLPSALLAAADELPASVSDRARAIAERISGHVEHQG